MVGMRTIAIIGGGASGLAAAVAAGEAARERQADVRVRVFEADARVGRTILATGNGRCNFSNASIDAALYQGSDFVEEVLARFEEAMAASDEGDASAVRAAGGAATSPSSFPNGVVRFFERQGLLWREEGEGRLYPQANKASVVLDVLRSSAQAAGVVEERCETRIVAVEPPREPGRPFTLRTAEGVFERADAVIVSCGGRLSQALLPDIFEFRQTRPVLCPIAVAKRDAKATRELNNIRVKGSLALRRDGVVRAVETGEVMFRKFGLSGIAAFNLSRLMAPGDEVLVDFLPAMPAAEMGGFLRRRCDDLGAIYGPGLTGAQLLRGMVLPLVADVLLKRCGLDGDSPLAAAGDDGLARLVTTLKAFALTVEGPAEPEHAQVHRGGFDPWAFDPATLEALALPGLHVVGEALDVDAPCGGYNLHWAWATGILAGWHCVTG